MTSSNLGVSKESTAFILKDQEALQDPRNLEDKGGVLLRNVGDFITL
jgi:hypothetical protein